MSRFLVIYNLIDLITPALLAVRSATSEDLIADSQLKTFANEQTTRPKISLRSNIYFTDNMFK